MNFGLAILLGVACLVLPFFKFTIVWSKLLGAGLENLKAAQFICSTAILAITDIFVLALLIVVIKGLPGGSTMDLDLSAYFFIASVLLSLATTFLIRQGKKKEITES